MATVQFVMQGIIPVPEAGYSSKHISSNVMMKILHNKKDYLARKTSEADLTVAALKTNVQAAQDMNELLTLAVMRHEASKKDTESSLSKVSQKLSDRTQR